MKVTVPVGVPSAKVLLTLAVKVTVAPKAAGFGYAVKPTNAVPCSPVVPEVLKMERHPDRGDE